jgi:hypothetical protein
MIFYSLFLIMGHSIARTICYSYRWMFRRVTCDKFTWLHNIFLGKGTESLTCELLIIHLQCLLLSENWEQAGPLKIGMSLLVHVHRRCVLCRRTCSVGIYCHTLKDNHLVQLKGCLWSFIWTNVQADLCHVNSKQSDLLQYRTHTKHIYVYFHTSVCHLFE